MAEEVATSETAPVSTQERGLFSLYGYFDKKKEEKEPEEGQDEPAEIQTSQHHTIDPPHGEPAETEVKEERKHGDEIVPHADHSQTDQAAHLYPTHPPADASAAAAVEGEEKDGSGYDLSTSQHPPHAATETQVKKGRTQGDEIFMPHTDSQSQPAYDLYPTDPLGDAAPAVEEEEEEIRPPHTTEYTYPETQPAHIFPTDHPSEATVGAAKTEEERYDDQIIPPASASHTQTQPDDLFPIDAPSGGGAAVVENSQAGHAHSDKGQHIIGFDEKQATHGSSYSSGSPSDEKEEEEKKEKSESVKKNIEGKLPEEQPSPTECAFEEKKEKNGVDKMEEKFSPYSPEEEGEAEEKEEGVKKRSVKDRIKEKLAGVGHHSTNESGGEEKKVGLLDRIKEKIPGHHAKE